MLRQVAHRLMASDLKANRSPAKVALAATNVLGKLLGTFSQVLGEIGSAELFRRSLNSTEHTFPLYKEVRTADPSGLLAAVGVFLQKQDSDVAVAAANALLATYLELLATFIGERLTLQLLKEAWPDLLNSRPQEIQE